MTVAELIERLQNVNDKTAQVYLYDSYYGIGRAEKVTEETDSNGVAEVSIST